MCQYIFCLFIFKTIMLFTKCLLPHASTTFRKAICVGTGIACVPVAGAGLYYGTIYSTKILSSIFGSSEPKPYVYKPQPQSKFSLWYDRNKNTIKKYGEIPARVIGTGLLTIGSVVSAGGAFGLAQYVKSSTKQYLSFVKTNEECCKLIRQTLIHIPRSAGAIGLGAVLIGIGVGSLGMAEELITWEKSKIILTVCDKVTKLIH